MRWARMNETALNLCGPICRDSADVNPLLVWQHVTYSMHCTGMFIPAIYMKPKVDVIIFPSLCFCSFELEKNMTLVKFLAPPNYTEKEKSVFAYDLAGTLTLAK